MPHPEPFGWLEVPLRQVPQSRVGTPRGRTCPGPVLYEHIVRGVHVTCRPAKAITTSVNFWCCSLPATYPPCFVPHAHGRCILSGTWDAHKVCQLLELPAICNMSHQDIIKQQVRRMRIRIRISNQEPSKEGSHARGSSIPLCFHLTCASTTSNRALFLAVHTAWPCVNYTFTQWDRNRLLAASKGWLVKADGAGKHEGIGNIH